MGYLDLPIHATHKGVKQIQQPCTKAIKYTQSKFILRCILIGFKTLSDMSKGRLYILTSLYRKPATVHKVYDKKTISKIL